MTPVMSSAVQRARPGGDRNLGFPSSLKKLNSPHPQGSPVGNRVGGRDSESLNLGS